ncbi:MAG: sigma-70 family RNA polymerase sigma factor [Firmicutes bacterium]|nr:sigma-70 family RNA polymerase sigma factor [Bacillota bacterium]
MADRREVVAEWASQYADRVFRLAYALIGDRLQAEDAAQESLYHIARWCLSHPDFTPTDPWVYQVTRNSVRDLMRRQPPATVPLDESAAVGDNREDFRVDRLDVARALAQLSDPDREVLVFFYFLDLSTKEVAEVLKISPTAARIRLSRARKRFKEAFLAVDAKGEGMGTHEAR